MSTEAWFAAGFGAVFVALLFGTAIWLIASQKPVPPTAEWLLRVIMALAGAACGAILGGMLTVDLNVPQLAVKATSGFALFVLIYLVNPPRRISQQQTVGAGGTGIQIAGDNNQVKK